MGKVPQSRYTQWDLVYLQIYFVYRIAGKFRGVKNSFNSRNGGFRE